MSSFAVAEKQQVVNPVVIRARHERMEIIKKHMEADPKVRLLYSDKYFNLSNYADYATWENICLRRYDVAGIREAEETELQRWIAETPERQTEYGRVLADLKKRVCGPCGGRPPEKLLPGGLDQPERRADDRFPSSVDGQPDAEREDRQRAGHRQSVRLRAEPDEKNVRGLRSGHRSGDFRRHAETIHGQRTAADVGRLSATGLYPLRRQCRSDRRLRVP